MINKKIMKILAISTITLSLLIGSAILFVTKAVDQNMIKEKASRLVFNKTGRTLKIAGDVNWTIFPWLGVKINDVSLSNHPRFNKNYFARAKELGISVKLLPLITGKIEAKNLIIKNIDLNLIKNSSGKNNWQDLTNINGKPTKKISGKKKTLKTEKFTIKNITITNGNIFWQNFKTKKKIKINKLNLHCKKVNFERSFPVQASFNVLTPDLSLYAKLNTQATINLNKNIYKFRKLRLTGNIKDKTTKRFSTSVDLFFDLKSGVFAANNFQLNSNGTDITGQLKGTNINNTPKLSGNIKADKIKLANIHLDNFTTKISGTSNLINLQKINFDFYKGKGVGNANINLKTTAPRLNLNLTIKNMRTKPLLIDLAKYEKFSGTLTINTNIRTQGLDTKKILNNLNGNGNILLTKGSYQGLDVPYEVRRAHAILNMKPKPKKPKLPHTTNFDQLTANFNINNGLLNTNDLLVSAPDYKVTGKGKINLPTNKLNFSISAHSNNDKNFFVPIKITGSCNDPTIMPDAAVIIKQGAKKAVKKIGEQLQKDIIPEKIKKALQLDKLFR